MIRSLFTFCCVLGAGFMLLGVPDHAVAADALYPGVSRTDTGTNPGAATGTMTTCENVWKTAAGGKSIGGGRAGLDAGGSVCFGGGGKSFCADMQSSFYQCAGVDIIEGDGVDIEWRAFDAAEDIEEEEQNKYYQLTTRDPGRGRAGHDMPLFMNAHGICRKIDNTEKKELPLFMGVLGEDEWRTVHGVPAGSDPNGGYTVYANEKGELGEIQAKMTVCCSPVVLNICGSPVQTTYAQVGDTISVWGANGGHASVTCFANNDWRVAGIAGICGEGGGGGGGDPGEDPGGTGMYNPNSGGVMTKDDWNRLDGGTQKQLEKQGYRDIDDTTPRAGDKKIMDPPDDVQVSSKQAKLDTEVAKAAAEAEAERIEEENKRKEEEARKAAEEAQKEAEEEEEEDDDDDDDS